MSVSQTESGDFRYEELKGFYSRNFDQIDFYYVNMHTITIRTSFKCNRIETSLSNAIEFKSRMKKFSLKISDFK